MGAITRAVRAAVKPMSTRIHRLARGRGTRRPMPRAQRHRHDMQYGWVLSPPRHVRWRPVPRPPAEPYRDYLPPPRRGPRLTHLALRPRRGSLRADERAWRERTTMVVVPSLVGRSIFDALELLEEAGLYSWPLDLPAQQEDRDELVVLDQEPAAGEPASLHSVVVLHVGRGPGDAGVREPRRPTPPLHTLSGTADEPGRPAGH